MEQKVVQYRMQFMVRRNIAGESPDTYFKNLGESIQFCAMSHILGSIGLPAVERTVLWTKAVMAGSDAGEETRRQIRTYFKELEE